MAAASLPPRLHPTLVTSHHHSPVKSNFPSSVQLLRNPNPSFSSSSTTVVAFASSSSWEHEEQRWLREEQRWLREEQRWLREELRWSSERDALLREIAALRLRIDALEGERSPLADAVEAVLVAAKERRLITGVEKDIVEEAEVKEMVYEGTRMSEEEREKETDKVKTERRTLRMGSEGEDVREMQEALQRLGFYSGEDDMEYSSFSSGTARAVKTWQASLGATDNGIMTSELLEKLFVELYLKDPNQEGSADKRDNMIPLERKVVMVWSLIVSTNREFGQLRALRTSSVVYTLGVAEGSTPLHGFEGLAPQKIIFLRQRSHLAILGARDSF